MNIEKELHKYIYSNKVFTNDISMLPGNEIVINLKGDWKHDHLRLDHLVQQFCNNNGFMLKDKSMDVIHDDGSDFYTADHYYKIVENI